MPSMSLVPERRGAKDGGFCSALLREYRKRTALGSLSMAKLTRRGFAKPAAIAGIGTALSVGRVFGANERVRLGFIGLGNRGDQVLDGFLVHKDCETVALCDIHQPYIDFAAKKAGGKPF